MRIYMDKVISKLMKTTKAPGDYTGADGLLYCGKCRTPKQMRLGFNPATGKDDPTVVPTACQCQQEAGQAADERDRREKFEARMKNLNSSGITCPGSLRHTFADDDGQRPEITAACQRYVEHWDEMAEKNVGILFYGTVGTGKTFYAACIANALLDRQVTAAATSFPRLLNLLQGTPDKQKQLDSLARYKLLIIDDLGVERDSTFSLEQIFNVVDARSSAHLPVIVTTNLSMEELKNPPSVQYGRIYDRVLEMCQVPLKLTGDSRRKQNADNLRAWAQKVILGGTVDGG